MAPNRVELCDCRYRSGGGKCQNQLTVNELRLFVRQLYALPCVLSQTPLLKVTYILLGEGTQAFVLVMYLHCVNLLSYWLLQE